MGSVHRWYRYKLDSTVEFQLRFRTVDDELNSSLVNRCEFPRDGIVHSIRVSAEREWFIIDDRFKPHHLKFFGHADL